MSIYVPYHAAAAAKARELIQNETNIQKRFSIITKWVSKNFVYDYIRAITIPKRGHEIPDVERCWEKRRGICMDIASMTTGMLRIVGVNAYMVFGRTENGAHAWVEANINNKIYRYDFTGKAKKYIREKLF